MLFKGRLKIVVTLLLALSFLSGTLLKAQEIPNNPTAKGLGIRGNGENIAAHWGGLARLTEEYGTFGTVSGGSSASITIFLYESALLNPALACTAEEIQVNPNCEKERLSFLIKSFEGIVDAIPETENVVDLTNMYSKTKEIGEDLNQLICEGKILGGPEQVLHLGELIHDVDTLMNSAYGNTKNPLLQEVPNWELIASVKDRFLELLTNPTQEQVKKVQNLLGQVKQSYDVFGKFNAKDDDALFVRPGLVNFKNMGSLTGRMANLLAARGLSSLDPALAKDLDIYVKECSKGSIGKEWHALKGVKLGQETCGDLLRNLVIRYDEFLQANKNKIALRENDLPGETLPHFNPIISTSLVHDPATIQSWIKAQQNFMKGEDKDKWDWKPDFNDVKFGYWVKKDMQDTVRENLKKICAEQKDYVMCKGMVIGNHAWKTILALSPAEPGLARVQHFNEVLKTDPTSPEPLNYLSLGGWSDLFPQKILKAGGATTQTLLTRRGYHTYFGQGVMIRLGVGDLTHNELAYLHQKDGAKKPSEPDFESAPEQFPKNPKLRTTGNWGQGYNLHNPASSFNQALLEAAVVVCTHWDAAGVSQWKEMIRDSYNSIFYVKDSVTFPIPQSSTFLPVQPGETPKDMTQESGAKYLAVGKEGIGPDHPWFNKGCTGILEYAKDLPMHQSPFFQVGETATSAKFDDEQ